MLKDGCKSCEAYRLPHQAPSARVMSGKLAEHMLGLCKSAPKRPQEGIEVISPRCALAPDELSDPSRTSTGLFPALIAEPMGRTSIKRL